MTAAHAKSWTALDVIATSPSREAIEYGLMEAGALGTETSSAPDDCFNVRGYFDAPPDIELVRAELIQALKIHGQFTSFSLNLKTSEIADRDWLAEWKKNWRPVEVGRFIIAPPWIESAALASSGRSGAPPIIIRINPGMAFGTGTHETTRLCLKAIEKCFQGGSLLDVGAGTGILAIAAAKMFPDARIEACDTDAEAIEIARDNARLNDVADRVYFRVGSVNNETESADLVCANLTAPVIVELLPLLLGATCGRLVLSGILDSQVEMVKSRLLELAVVDFEIDQDGEWAALTI
ncbi:MAG TPA: 50S ribosomal protein L11 methyltransferase [Pyrinomonadaceae bacterium]